MDQATISSRTLEIDGMSGETCVKKVTGALKDVHGVSTQSVKVGSATISANQTGCDAACRAIDHAGFKVREDKGHGDKAHEDKAHEGLGDGRNAHGSDDATGNAGQRPSGAGSPQSAAMGNKAAGSNGDKPTMNSGDKSSGDKSSGDKHQGDRHPSNSNADHKSTLVTPTPITSKK